MSETSTGSGKVEDQGKVDGEVEGKGKGRRQSIVGRVVSDAMDKTVVVRVETTIMHPLYHRYMRRTKRIHAHDERNECRVGDEVMLTASRPLSKTKRWRVRQIVQRAEVIES